MDTPIQSFDDIAREAIKHHREKARAAFLAGKSKHDHNLPMGSNALVEHVAEFDRLANAAMQLDHSAMLRGQRVDAGQEHR